MSYSIISTEHIALCFLGSPNAGWEAELPAVGTSPSHYCILLNVLCPVIFVFSSYLHALIFSRLFSPHQQAAG